MRAIVSLSLSLILVSACGGSTRSSVVGPSGEATRCQISLTSPPVPSGGAHVNAQLTTARDCAWSATSEVPWLVLEPSSGQGEGTIVLAAEPNPTGRSRNANIAINDQRFVITQDPQACRFDVTPREVKVPAFGGRPSVQVTTLEGCDWTTASSQPWMRVISGSGGESSRSIEIGVESNAGDDRSAQLTVAGIIVDVQQAAASAERIRCEYSMDPGAGPVFPAAGGEGRTAVHVQPACHWFARSSQSWIVIVSNPNGAGVSEIQYRVAPNPSRSQRSAQVVVGTVRHVVTQRGTG
jgi:hypothetical protein